MTDDVETQIVTTVTAAFGSDVPAQIRAIQVSWNDARVHVLCFINGKIDEDLRTEIGYIGSGIMDAFLPERRTFIELSRLDPPAPLPPPKFAQGVLVFERA